ncbi:hypothetical protein GGD65_006952 [Bradyrhizobium sp. CIR18]|nr:hypothetical protein [Bradyrhizobium sp. CIR18]
MLRSQSAAIPPVSANGTVLKTRAGSRAERPEQKQKD